MTALSDILALHDLANQTGRSGSGRLRNFRAMSPEKLQKVAAEVDAEDNDPEAQEAINAEYGRRIIEEEGT